MPPGKIFRMNVLQLNWDTEPIRQAADAHWPGFSVEVLPQVDSTNTLLMERARSGHTAPVLVVAEQQTAGRGRMGRQWVSSQPVGGALTFSLGVLLPECDVSGLSLVVGYSVVQSLDAQHRHALRLKWPNDLWYQQRKLGGVLVEICNVGAQRYAVVGVGINISAPPALPPAQAGQAVPLPPAWVQEFAPTATAPAVLCQLAAPLAAALRQFAAQGFAPWQARFATRDGLHGQAVDLSDGSTGIAQGVAANGALLVRTAQGPLRSVFSEEISVRPRAAG